MQGLCDQLFADSGTVGVSGVDEVDAELDRPTQYRQGTVVVGGWSPDALAGDLHRPVAESMDRQVAADREGRRWLAGGGPQIRHAPILRWGWPHGE